MNTLWMLSAAALTLVSHLYNKESDAPVYVALLVIYMSVVYFLKNRIRINLKFLPFLVGSILIMSTEPLHEDDHYRYLWEGKVIAKLHNPYKEPPVLESLDHIYFSKREKISFSHLTTVYPPLSLLFFSTSSPFSYKIGLRVLMFFNMLIVGALLYFLVKKECDPFLICLCFPYLQKEFIGAVHIDLLAAFICFLPLLTTIKNRKVIFVTQLASLWVKITSLFALPFFLLEKESLLKRSLIILTIPISLIVSLYFLTGDFSRLSGVLKFSSDWVWNPGLYALLVFGFDISEKLARSTCLMVFTISALFLYLRFYLNKVVDKENYLILTFSILMFCTPVYNAWYGIWILIPALIKNHKWAVLYAISSSLSYLYYSDPEIKKRDYDY